MAEASEGDEEEEACTVDSVPRRESGEEREDSW